LVSPLDWQLLTGPVPVVLRLAAGAAGTWLLLRLMFAVGGVWARVLRYTATLVVAVVLTATSAYLAREVWTLFPDRLPFVVHLWVGAAFFAAIVAVSVVISCRRWRTVVTAFIAASLVWVACANQVNGVYAAYPSPRDVLGLGPRDDITLPPKQPHSLPQPVAGTLESHWTSPRHLVTRGKLTSAMIPGSSSGFAARAAKIYLPPAYFAQPPPRLPVLVLLSGQPGMPQDWLSAGKLVRTMDRFVQAHHGLAPVVVVPDATGSQFADPLCLNSARGNVDAYLALDVPAWVGAHLTVDTSPKAWAVAGASYGGTCALQLATNHPSSYPTFIDIAGSAEPTLGDRRRTVAEAFAGDEAAFRRVNPLDLLRLQRYPSSAGAIVIGSADSATKADARSVFEATKAAGMNSHYRELPGSHDWRVFSAALESELPWLARHWRLID
jgi:S-formylglutathione hydrolase FrmB